MPALPGPEDFRLGRSLGDGATAEVYQAIHVPTGAEVALKVWKTSTADLDDDARRRFSRECSVLREVSRRTDRVVGYQWSGLSGGYPWLAMDLCDGSLADRIAPGPLPVDQVLTLADDVLVALEQIHASGHLHRDIKPANVLLRGDRAVLADFGIALAADGWTRDGSAGTLGFLAPEVLGGADPSVRSDLYSVAKTLFAAAPAQLPPLLEAILTRAASHNPADRPVDAASLRAALAELAPPAQPVAQWPVKSAQPATPQPPAVQPVAARPATPQPPAAQPVAPRPGLVVTVQGAEWVVPAGAERVVGRGATADIDVQEGRISRRHARIHELGDSWRVTDLASRNGLWHNGKQVPFVDVDRAVVDVQLGDPDGPTLRLARQGGPEPVATPNTPAPLVTVPVESGLRELGGAPVSIGRARDNQVVLPDLMVSRHHAELRATTAGFELRDLGSGNGTFVNGRPVTRCQLAPGDLIGIGPHTLRFEGTQLVELQAPSGVDFGAADLSVAVGGGVTLVHHVSFNLRPRTLMAVVGPSGAGKSTLLNALSGLRPATSGHVAYAGRDLYTEYDQLSQRIGFVPQQDILHQVLTVEQALAYGARLRFPADTSVAEREERIKEVAAELSLTERMDRRISTLSGGERKRASTALELVTRPSLLFLDEPTSGLDADLDRDVMHTLRSLADDGRTVIVVTHNLEHLAVCDVVLVLAKGGHVAYLGPPAGVFEYFGVSSWADLFALLKTQESTAWASRFASWPGRDRRSQPPQTRSAASPPAELAPVRRQSGFSQTATLVRRQLAVTRSDPVLSAILLLMPFALAAIARVIPSGPGLGHTVGNLDAEQVLLVLVVGGALMGTAGSVRELVKERAIYLRERSVGLSIAAYLTSKVIVLTVLGAAQGALLTFLALWGVPRPPGALVLPTPTLEFAVVVALVTAVSAIFGLAISAMVRDENQAMPPLVLLTMAQLVISGGLVKISGRLVLEQVSWILPARWAYAATAATVDLNFLHADPHGDPLWKHAAGTWLLDVGLLLALGVAVLSVVAVLLRRLDPNR